MFAMKNFKSFSFKKLLTSGSSVIKANQIEKIGRSYFCHHQGMDKCPYGAPTLIRKPAPSFKGTAWWNDDFKTISIDNFKGKWVCLFFYPLDFTFVCPTEIVDFNAKAEDFAKQSI
jgi:hypothetical protein